MTSISARLGLRGSLLRTMLALILLICGALSAISIVGAHRAVGHLSRALVERTTQRVESELERFFGAVTSNLLVARDWGAAGRIDPTDPVALNHRFCPVLERNPQVTSMLVANERGLEYMLLKTGDTWTNRLTRADEWGTRTRWLTWSDPATPVGEEWRELDYDPRRRPWYRAAIEGTDADTPIWTEPYTFFTTKDPGITASVRWQRPDSDLTFVVAFDVMLMDLSRFTTELEVSEHGRAMVVTDDGRVLGLPRHTDYEDPADLRAAVLTTTDDLKVPALRTAFSLRRDDPDLRRESFRFDVAGEYWWSGFRPVTFGQGPTFWIGVVVPEADFLAEVQRQRDLTLLVTAVAIVVAVAVALVLDRIIRRRMSKEVDRLRRVGQYTLSRKLGAGGMGSVYLARHAMLRRPCALKLIRSDLSKDDSAIARFEREVQLTAGLTSPHTIAIYDYGPTPDGIFYYAMEYLAGVDLGRLVDSCGQQPPARIIHLLRQACASLAEAHAIGLIHRDIKPANLIVCERGGVADVVKVLDFGLVKDVSGDGRDVEATAADVITGTPLYMSPEGIRSSEVDARSDLYALGAVGYYLLTGEPVFRGKTALEVLAGHLHGIPTRPSERLGSDLPTDLEDVLLACLKKDPGERPDDAETLSERLGACADADRWSRDDARTWWRVHGDALLPSGDEEERPARSDSRLEVDLGPRAVEAAPTQARFR